MIHTIVNLQPIIDIGRQLFNSRLRGKAVDL